MSAELLNADISAEGFDAAPMLPWRRLAFPIDWTEVFGASAPLHLEIGFGDGRYTVRRALDEPAASFVGLEISSASIQRAWGKVERAGLGNVALLKVGATFAVQNLFAPHSLSSVTVNFPDPWPKERHVKNRLLQRSFYELAASRLLPGGTVRLATDHPDYLEFAVREAESSGLFAVHETAPPAAVFETKYALKWKGQGKPLHYRVFTYNGAATRPFPVLERPTLMPHALLTGSLPANIVFEKQVLAYGDGHVILHEVANSLGSDDVDRDGDQGSGQPEKWLVRATVDEPGLKQQLLVVVKRRSGGELIVRLESFGDPIITKTVRGAVHGVTEWLLGLPGLRVQERNY